MSVYRIVRNVLGGTIPLALLAIVIVGCGSSTTTGSTAASTPTGAAACLSATSGTIQNIGNTTLQITSLQGKTVQATFTSKTIFTRQATLTAADLKTGMPVSVTVKQNADNTYSALTVSIRSSQTRLGGFTRGSGSGSGLCNGQRPRRAGTPGAFGGRGFSGTPSTGTNGTGAQTISGTISQVNGNSLVVTDTSSNDFTLTLTSTTRMTEQQTITASELHTGEIVTITGTANSKGIISAGSVSVLQNIPFRRLTPKLTPTTTGA